MTRGILVYYPDAAEARAYADRIRLPSRAFRVHVASTPDEAAGPGADAEIFYCWGPPRPLLAGAKGLRWIQCMGAGVERLLVPELPDGSGGGRRWIPCRCEARPSASSGSAILAGPSRSWPAASACR